MAVCLNVFVWQGGLRWLGVMFGLGVSECGSWLIVLLVWTLFRRLTLTETPDTLLCCCFLFFFSGVSCFLAVFLGAWSTGCLRAGGLGGAAKGVCACALQSWLHAHNAAGWLAAGSLVISSCDPWLGCVIRSNAE